MTTVLTEARPILKPLRRRSGAGFVLLQAARTRRGTIGLSLAGLIVAVAAIWVFRHSVFANCLYFAALRHTFSLGASWSGHFGQRRSQSCPRWRLGSSDMAVAATVIGVALGTVAGVAAAYLRGSVETVIMRLADVILAFPQLVFALLLV